MEIERKFLINNFPELDCIKTVKILQGYISINPEVRIRSYECNDHIDYKMTIKGNGNLSREEVEFYIEKDIFETLSKMINKPLITKIYKKYQLDSGLILECSHVDHGQPFEFMYAEVEFTTEDQAKAFDPPDYLGKEVTYYPSYKMKNYWATTR